MQTSELKWWARRVLLEGILLALLFLIFRWVSFSVWQSFTLVVLAEIGQKLVYARGQGNAFPPYRVVIEPKFDDLLLDYKLQPNIERMTELRASWKTKPQRLISFTVLRHGLIYSDTDKYFGNELTVLEEPIEGIVFQGDWVWLRELPESNDGEHHGSPHFYFSRWHGSGGHSLGLEVYREWWEKMSYTMRPHAEEDGALTRRRHAFEWMQLRVAAIPYAVFNLFEYYDPREPRRWRKIWSEVNTQLDLHGWKLKAEYRDVFKDSFPDYARSELDLQLEHKYFSVRVYQI